MITADSSSFIAYLEGEEAKDTQQLSASIAQGTLILPPPVLTEVLSDYTLADHVIKRINELPILPVFSGFWYRAGKLRAALLEKKLKARLADCLIAQSCMDHNVPLITRDEDFRHFVTHGLVLI